MYPSLPSQYTHNFRTIIYIYTVFCFLQSNLSYLGVVAVIQTLFDTTILIRNPISNITCLIARPGRQDYFTHPIFRHHMLYNLATVCQHQRVPRVTHTDTRIDVKIVISAIAISSSMLV